MISLYSGTPGSGKSLYAAYVIYARLKVHKRVIANFNINYDVFGRKKDDVKPYFTWLDNSELTPSTLVQFAKENHVLGRESQTLVIIDECAVMFNSRDISRKDRAEWIVFFQQHRKLGFDIILIAQQDRMLDRQIRGFIEVEYKHRNVRRYKMFGFILSLIFGGLFVRVELWYGMRLKAGAEFFVLHRKKAKIYNTYEIFKDAVPKAISREAEPSKDGRALSVDEKEPPQKSQEPVVVNATG